MTSKALTAKINAARRLREDAQRAASCRDWDSAATNYLKAGKLFLKGGSRIEAEQAWRRACEFAEREAHRIARMSEPSNLN